MRGERVTCDFRWQHEGNIVTSGSSGLHQSSGSDASWNQFDKPGWDVRIWLDGFPEQQSGEIPSLPLALLLGNSIPVTHQDQFILLSEDRLCLVSMIYVSHKWYLSHINDICLMYDDYPDTDVQDYASCSGYLCCNVKTSDVPSVIVISRCIWCDICDIRCFKALNV